MTFRPEAKWDHWTREEARRFQARTLVRFLREQIIPFSPFYREHLKDVDLESIRSIDDLHHLPFTTKSDIVPSDANPEGPRNFVLQPTPEAIKAAWPLRKKLPLLAKKLRKGTDGVRADLVSEYSPVKMLFTTGRSAASLPFFLSLHDLEILRTTGRRITEVLDLVPGVDRVVSLFPYAPHLAFWQVNECAAAAGVLTLNTGGGRAMGGDRILGAIDRLKPTVVCGMPGYFYHILRRARREGTDLSSVEKVALGGEAVSPNLKKRIVTILKEMGAKDPRVSSVFGFTESRQCWAECFGADNTGFHTSPDLSIMEIIDPDTGETVPDGETGELVYTTLEGRGSCLIRYRTGDIIEGGMTWDRCPGCGRTMPRVMSTVRRVSNVKSLDISKVKGTLINFNTLSEILGGDAEIEEWQLVLQKVNDDPFEMDELVLYCALGENADAAGFSNRIDRRIREVTEVGVNDIIVTSIDEMLERVGMEENTKEERIVDRRAAPAGTGR